MASSATFQGQQGGMMSPAPRQMLCRTAHAVDLKWPEMKNNIHWFTLLQYSKKTKIKKIKKQKTKESCEWWCTWGTKVWCTSSESTKMHYMYAQWWRILNTLETTLCDAPLASMIRNTMVSIVASHPCLRSCWRRFSSTASDSLLSLKSCLVSPSLNSLSRTGQPYWPCSTWIWSGLGKEGKNRRKKRLIKQ